MSIEQQLQAVAVDAGVTAWVHAERLGGPPDSVSLNADVPVAVASLYKLPVALAWADLVSGGDLDPFEVLHLEPEQRPFGPTGVAMLLDPVAISQRDAVRLMVAVSDNACADAVLSRVGVQRVAERMRDEGLLRTVVRHGAGESLTIVQREMGVPDPALAEPALAATDADVTTSQYDAALASASTAAELCRLLAVLWRRVGPAYDVVRDAMARQAWRHRIASGFPHDDVMVHGKTGTLARMRHEAAVVTYPGEYPVAVAVLTRAARAERHLPSVDAAIGELARVAVTPLRLGMHQGHDGARDATAV